MNRFVGQHSRAFTRRVALGGGLAAATAIVPGLLAAPAARADDEPAGQSRRMYARRAQDSYATLQRYFYDPASSFYLE